MYRSRPFGTVVLVQIGSDGFLFFFPVVALSFSCLVYALLSILVYGGIICTFLRDVSL